MTLLQVAAQLICLFLHVAVNLLANHWLLHFSAREWYAHVADSPPFVDNVH